MSVAGEVQVGVARKLVCHDLVSRMSCGMGLASLGVGMKGANWLGLRGDACVCMAACVLVLGERFACGSTVVSIILHEESLSERLTFFFSNLSLFRASVNMVAMLLVLLQCATVCASQASL